jgi:hypothetical protein
MSAALYVHRYRLRLRGGAANAVSSRRELAGFLLRVGDGFGGVHPWPELGDPEMGVHEQSLRTGMPTALVTRAIACATLDGAARQSGVSLFAGTTLPRSHATVVGDVDFAALRAEGFTRVKLKAAGDYMARVAMAVAAGLRVRLDFNATGTAKAWAALRPWLEWIDFVEDPMPYDAATWSQLAGFRIAADREVYPHYDVRVVKPAMELTPEATCPLVFTSSMDHPVGQSFAAYEAARFAGEQWEGGLLTHRLFEADPFTEALAARGAVFQPAAGTGLGFDDLLAGLSWERVSGSAPVRGWSPDDERFWAETGPYMTMNPRLPMTRTLPKLPVGMIGFTTSGSTGMPRIACVTRAALLANAAAVNAHLEATADDVWLRPLPDFHVGGMSIHARAYLSGSRVVVMDERWHVEQFMARLRGVTLTSLVPTQLFDLVAQQCRAPESLRAVLVGGGRLAESLRVEALALGWPVRATYGMTEASSQVATDVGDGVLRILPIWETRVDAESRLSLRGPALFSGWMDEGREGWSFAEATDGDGWYRTNDRVRLAGAMLEPLGRSDRQVKVLGELVDLDAIERRMAELGMEPESGVVMAVPADRSEHELLLVTDDPQLAALHACYLEGCAPFARLRMVVLPALPRSPLGKVRRAEALTLVRDAPSSPA